MKILITAPYNRKGRLQLEQTVGEVVYKPWKNHGRGYNEDELIALLSDNKADALITEHDNVSSKVIETYPDLEFIGVCRGTPSNVAVETAKNKNISVYTTPGRNAQAVAELFIGNVISLLRKTDIAKSWLVSEKWERGAHTAYLQFKGNELAGKKVGMVGLGAVGRCIGRMLKCFPCEIFYYDPYVDEQFDDYRSVALQELFEISDIISINLPVTDETRGMIDRRLLQKMHQEAVFVNMARAEVVNTADLYDILKNQNIKGAVLDVYDNEPPKRTDYDLINLPNVLATPHIAGATHEVEDHHVDIMNQQLVHLYRKTNH